MLTVLKFQAEWCGPCKAIQPTITKLKEEFSKDVTFTEVDIDSNPNLRVQYQIRSIPSFVLIKDGQEISRRVGSATFIELKDWLNEYRKV